MGAAGVLRIIRRYFTSDFYMLFYRCLSNLDQVQSFTELRYIVGFPALFRILGASCDTDGSLLSCEQRFIPLQVARPFSF